MNGTGIILPIIAMMSARGSGTPSPTPIGIAPRSSMIGSIDTNNTKRQWSTIMVNYSSIMVSSVSVGAASSAPWRTCLIFSFAIPTVVSSGYITERSWFG